MYRFALNINDEKNNLNPEDGLDIGDLSELTGNLKKALQSKKNGKCTLSGVENHGYTPNFSTASEFVYTKFIEVHKDIQEKSVKDLSKDEAQYATTLKKILSTDKYLEPIDNNKKPLFRLTSKDIDTAAENYSVLTTKSGIISEIGSPKLDDERHIYIHNIDYKIYITATQEQILKEHYRKDVVELKLKQRRSIKSGRILNAILVSYKIKPNSTFGESLSTLTQEQLNVFDNIKTKDDLLTLLRS